MFFRSDDGAGGLGNSTPVDVALSGLTSGFTSVSIPVPNAGGGFDPAATLLISLEIEAGTAFGDTFQAPATIVYFDSVGVSSRAFDYTFDMAPSPLEFGISGARPVAGSTLAWAAAFPYHQPPNARDAFPGTRAGCAARVPHVVDSRRRPRCSRRFISSSWCKPRATSQIIWWPPKGSAPATS